MTSTASPERGVTVTRFLGCCVSTPTYALAWLEDAGIEDREQGAVALLPELRKGARLHWPRALARRVVEQEHVQHAVARELPVLLHHVRVQVEQLAPEELARGAHGVGALERGALGGRVRPVVGGRGRVAQRALFAHHGKQHPVAVQRHLEVAVHGAVRRSYVLGRGAGAVDERVEEARCDDVARVEVRLELGVRDAARAQGGACVRLVRAQLGVVWARLVRPRATCEVLDELEALVACVRVCAACEGRGARRLAGVALVAARVVVVLVLLHVRGTGGERRGRRVLHALRARARVGEGGGALLLELRCVSGSRTDAVRGGAGERVAAGSHGASERDRVWRRTRCGPRVRRKYV